MEMTLAILKPDSVRAGHAGSILALLEQQEFEIAGLKLMRLTENQARAFYEVHREKGFYDELVAFMTSGPIIPVALRRDGAVAFLREVMGATDSTKAEVGTIRALYGTDVQENAIHGSDSPENAAKELAFFFSRSELLSAASA